MTPTSESALDRTDRIPAAVVLTGGGARGAYEAGVIEFLFGRFTQRLGTERLFDLYAGTSLTITKVPGI